jgi:hypothetical protein
MENDEVQSANEIKLREWLNENNVHPGDMAMQSLIINSFHSEYEDEYNDDDLVPLDEVDMDENGISEGFDYKKFEKSDDEDDEAWDESVVYGLNHPDKFLAYINDNWR